MAFSSAADRLWTVENKNLECTDTPPRCRLSRPLGLEEDEREGKRTLTESANESKKRTGPKQKERRHSSVTEEAKRLLETETRYEEAKAGARKNV